jgi:myosin heavy subunit
VIKGVSDKAEFKKTCNSMTEAGISVNEQVEIFRVLAGILHLGNVKFTENRVNNQDGAQITTVDGK